MPPSFSVIKQGHKGIISAKHAKDDAETNEEIQKIAQEVSPLLSDFKNDLLLNEALFKRVKSVYDRKNSMTLTAEESMLLEKQYKGFARNGANLSEEKKENIKTQNHSFDRTQRNQNPKTEQEQQS